MAMHRIARKAILVLLILATGTFLFHAVTASAYTHDQALAKARKEQAWDCTWGNPFYRCITPWLIIGCHSTRVNKVGYPQHICGGMFERERRVRSKYQYCTTLYKISPFGRLLSALRTYKCHDGIPPYPNGGTFTFSRRQKRKIAGLASAGPQFFTKRKKSNYERISRGSTRRRNSYMFRKMLYLHIPSRQ